MATIVTRYLDSASAGGNGTTNALSGANAAYATFASWQAAEVKDLVTANEIHKLICSGGLITEAFTHDGWTTDVDHFVWVTVDPASRHNGQFNTGFRTNAARNWTTLFYVKQNYTICEWLSITNTGLAGTAATAMKVLAEGVIIVGELASGTSTAIALAGNVTNAKNYVVGCLVHDSKYGFSASNWDKSFVYNSSAVNCTNNYSFEGNHATFTLINCAAFNGVNDDFDSTTGGIYAAATDYNASEDLTAPGTTIATGIVVGDFTDTAANDYSLSGTTSNLYAAGRSIEAELAALDRTQYTVPRLDLAGNPLTTDIGAFSYVAVGASLTVNNATSSHTAGNVTLSQAQSLTVANASHAHTAGNVTLSQGSSLSVNSASHTLNSNTVAIDQAQSLIVASASHILTSDTVTLAQGQMIVSTGATHSLTSTSPALSQGQTLSVHDSADALSSDNVTLAQIQALVAQNATHGLTSGNVTFNPAAVIPSPDRTYMADASNRTATASATGRTYTVPARN